MTKKPNRVAVSKLRPLPGGRQMPLFYLPPEVVALVADNLALRDVYSLRRCSKQLHDLCGRSFYRQRAACFRFGKYQLEWAAGQGRVDEVRKMVRAGADTSLASSAGLTALHRAADEGHVEIVEVFLKGKADATLQSDRGDTPLHRAAQNGHIACVKLLVEHSADVSARNNDGKTPVDLAMSRTRSQVAEYLKTKGSAVILDVRPSETPLHAACCAGLVSEVKQILNERIQLAGIVNARDENLVTPLHHASASGIAEAVQLLLDAGADVLARDARGGTPLHWANSRSPEIVKTLIDKGADVSCLTRNDLTPMLRVCCNSHVDPEVFRIFIDAGGHVQGSGGISDHFCLDTIPGYHKSKAAAADIKQMLEAVEREPCRCSLWT